MGCTSQKQTDVVVSDLLKFSAKIRSEEKGKISTRPIEVNTSVIV